MRRSDRLFDIMQILRDGQLHRAQDIAARMAVSPRTIYRDMDTLMASGVPVAGARGVGYRITGAITLPPLTLTPAELEALNLGLAVAAQVADGDLQAAADSLADKIDAVLPTQSAAEADMWKFARYAFGDATHVFTHLPVLRAAIKARQKLRLVYTNKDEMVTTRTVRPLLMEHWGRVWTLTAWCELRAGFRVFRLDLIESAEALPELFVDEPGKTIDAYAP
jgi:predicted DNA-binding transcriptional regulator YafY|tara:strand:- start:25910 stop:26575 length:666 start_codon:yes stop_codon:yes gene_type:complete